eukprot:Awhi_evm1s13608
MNSESSRSDFLLCLDLGDLYNNANLMPASTKGECQVFIVQISAMVTPLEITARIHEKIQNDA